MYRTLKTGFFFLLTLLSFSLFLACGSIDQTTTTEPEALGQAEQGLDAAHIRVVQECSQAMSGSWYTYNSTNWPSTTMLANYGYTNADLGAWNLLLGSAAYDGFGYPSFYVSCMRTRIQGHLPAPYTHCYLSTTNGFGSYEMPSYTCQGYCPSAKMRGGQCKAFMNLVAYRSGLYQGPNNSFKAFPSDACIKYTTASCNANIKILRPSNDPDMPNATYANTTEGDYLRMPGGHAAIVVRKIDSQHVVVFDSNWVGFGDGDEVVGSHVLGFTFGGNVYDLNMYRNLKCVYTGTC